MYAIKLMQVTIGTFQMYSFDQQKQLNEEVSTGSQTHSKK